MSIIVDEFEQTLLDQQHETGQACIWLKGLFDQSPSLEDLADYLTWYSEAIKELIARGWKLDGPVDGNYAWVVKEEV